MYTAFMDKEISHQSPGRHLRWHWMHPLRCLCCSWCCAAELVLLCTKLRSCRNRQHSHTTQHNWRICRPKQNLHLELLGKLLWSEEFSQVWSFHVTSKLSLTMMERIVYTIVCMGSNLDIVWCPYSTDDYPSVMMFADKSPNKDKALVGAFSKHCERFIVYWQL